MPTLAYTWTTLRAALQTWPVNAGTAYVAELDHIIGLGEVRLVRDLNLDIFDHVTTLVIEQGERIVPKPADCIVARSVRVGPETFFLVTEDDIVIGLEDGSGGLLTEDAVPATDLSTGPVEQRSWDYCQEFAPDPALQGRPRFYNELNESELELVPTADARYGVILRYVRRPIDALSSSRPTDTSWLSRVVPDALFAACLMEAEHFLKADDRYEDFRRKYETELLPNARLELRQLIRAGDYTPLRPAAQKVT